MTNLSFFNLLFIRYEIENFSETSENNKKIFIEMN